MKGGGKAFKNGFIVAGGWFEILYYFLFAIMHSICTYRAILHMY